MLFRFEKGDMETVTLLVNFYRKKKNYPWLLYYRTSHQEFHTKGLDVVVVVDL